MKIVDVKLHLLDTGGHPTWRELVPVQGLHPLRWHGGMRHRAPGRNLATWLRIITDEGVEGWYFGGGTEASARREAEVFAQGWKQELVGENPLKREYIWRKLWDSVRAYSPGPMEAIDIALWDLAGKAAGMSIAELAGQWRDMIPCYHVDNVYRYEGGEIGPEGVVKYALEAKASGFVGYKDHTHQGVKGNIEVFEALRDAVGPDWVLMHDATGQYRYPEALIIGRVLDKLNYYWFEEPVLDWDLFTLKKLSEDLRVPILALEHLPGGIYSAAQYIHAGAFDMVRNGTHKGGITGMIKMAHLAEAHGMNAEPVSSGACFGYVYIQMFAALSNASFYETSPARVAENARSAQAIGITNPLQLEHGYIRVPDVPGLGIELDRDKIENVTIEVC